MSTVDRPESRVHPPLVAGERLDQRTFHARYEAMPSTTRAELIGGIVYMPSPLGNDHGETDDDVRCWLVLYKAHTPGLRSSGNATTQLDDLSEVQPDGQLRIPSELGGQSFIDEHRYIRGAPELVIEVGRSSRRFDLGPKKADYERAGVREYLFVGVDPDEVLWFALREGGYRSLKPGPDGIFRSEVFPGLWLDPAALLRGDLHRLIAVLEQGIATPEHQAFVARLEAAAQGR